MSFPVLFFEKNANNFATTLNLKFDLVEYEEYMKLGVLFRIIFHLLWVFILGVKDVTKNLFSHAPEALSNMTQ